MLFLDFVDNSGIFLKQAGSVGRDIVAKRTHFR